MNICVETVSTDAAAAMKTWEAMCPQLLSNPKALNGARIMQALLQAAVPAAFLSEELSGIWRRGGFSSGCPTLLRISHERVVLFRHGAHASCHPEASRRLLRGRA